MKSIDSSILQHAQDLLSFIDQSPSPWHAVASIEDLLSERDYICLDETQAWKLQQGGRYYVVRDGSSVICFTIGKKTLSKTGFRIIGAHTDSPGFRIKPNAAATSKGIIRLGVEIYGGPILATFTDRDLSLAGRVTFKTENDCLETQRVSFTDPILRLPNLAIHMNRKVNEEGLKLDKQNQLALILSSVQQGLEPPSVFLQMLGSQLNIDPTSILSWDLAVCDTQKGVLYGPSNEYLANSQLDNLASCHAAITALLDQSSQESEATNICAFFDHEEIGSQSMKGADGNFLPDILERIAASLKLKTDAYKQALANSFIISADMAHAFQPNFSAAYEPDHPVFVNQGPVIKINANQRYSSESISDARFIRLCEDVKTPWQKYTHRSNLPCGSTIGPMTSARLGIRSVDVGNPMWAMHSIRESAGVIDHSYITQVFTHFFSGG